MYCPYCWPTVRAVHRGINFDFDGGIIRDGGIIPGGGWVTHGHSWLNIDDASFVYKPCRRDFPLGPTFDDQKRAAKAVPVQVDARRTIRVLLTCSTTELLKKAPMEGNGQ
jgi:hypothetical protein